MPGCFRKVFIAVLLMAVCGLTAHAQFGTISGVIMEAETGEPMVGVNVILVGTVRGTTTNFNGEYRIHVDPGRYVVKTSFIGYESIEKETNVGGGESVTLNFDLHEALLYGESIVILGSRSENRTALETTVPIDVISAEAGAPGRVRYDTAGLRARVVGHGRRGGGPARPAARQGAGTGQRRVLAAVRAHRARVRA